MEKLKRFKIYSKRHPRKRPLSSRVRKSTGISMETTKRIRPQTPRIHRKGHQVEVQKAGLLKPRPQSAMPRRNYRPITPCHSQIFVNGDCEVVFKSEAEFPEERVCKEVVKVKRKQYRPYGYDPRRIMMKSAVFRKRKPQPSYRVKKTRSKIIVLKNYMGMQKSLDSRELPNNNDTSLQTMESAYKLLATQKAMLEAVKIEKNTIQIYTSQLISRINQEKQMRLQSAVAAQKLQNQVEKTSQKAIKVKWGNCLQIKSIQQVEQHVKASINSLNIISDNSIQLGPKIQTQLEIIRSLKSVIKSQKREISVETVRINEVKSSILVDKKRVGRSQQTLLSFQGKFEKIMSKIGHLTVPDKINGKKKPKQNQKIEIYESERSKVSGYQ